MNTPPQLIAEAEALGYRLEWDPVSGSFQLFQPVDINGHTAAAVRTFLHGVRSNRQRRLAMEAKFRESPP